jgi:hypothetical protein
MGTHPASPSHPMDPQVWIAMYVHTVCEMTDSGEPWGMTCDSCEDKGAGALPVQQDPQWLHRMAVIGPLIARTKDLGPVRTGANGDSSPASAWLTRPSRL